MRILIACEESQAVCKEFRLKGHEAYSCDLQECSGGRPEWHYQQDIFDVIDFGWDMMIAFPPCTYLTVTANKWLKDQPKRESGKLVGKERRIAKIDAEDFFIKLFSSNIPKIAIENPIGSVNSIISPNQIIHPYYFGDKVSKATCLWLKNLPLLMHSKTKDLFTNQITHVQPEYYTTKTGKKYPKWSMIDAAKIKNLEERSKFRSKTFPGIAKAMADQWG
jgi:hypothetical protein